MRNSLFTTQGPSHSVKKPHAQWAHMCILFIVLREATKGQAKAPLRALSEEGPWSTRHGGYRENETLRWPIDYSKGIMGHCDNRGASSHLPPSLKIHFKVPSGSLKPWTQLSAGVIDTCHLHSMCFPIGISLPMVKFNLEVRHTEQLLQ